MLYDLIEQLDDRPSVYSCVIAQSGSLHQFGVATRAYPVACAARRALGWDLVYKAVVANGARVGYSDTRGALPAMIEVIELLPASETMFAAFRTAHDGWNGSNPVRALPPVKG